jgi:hypothetical protein
MSRLKTLPALALLSLLAACQYGPGAPPKPAGPTPSPSPSPSPTFGPNDIEHPTGALDVVLRMEQGGGFVPMGFLVTQAPAFTLYGDGTVIFKQIDTRQGDPIGGQAELPWLVGHLDEASVQALLLFALDTGRLAVARDSYDDPMIADAGTTIFTLNAGGLEKVVSVYALAETSQPGLDAADRHGFSQLAAVLNNIQAQVGIGLGELKPYDAELYRVFLVEGFGQPVGEPLAWPWTDLTVADWPKTDEPDSRSKILDREHVAEIVEVPNGGHVGVWVTAVDGSLVTFGVRPLLPEEVAGVSG